MPWKGRFCNYARFDGRLMPREAEVALVIDGRDFIYWRGVMEAWSS